MQLQQQVQLVQLVQLLQLLQLVQLLMQLVQLVHLVQLAHVCTAHMASSRRCPRRSFRQVRSHEETFVPPRSRPLGFHVQPNLVQRRFLTRSFSPGTELKVDRQRSSMEETTSSSNSVPACGADDATPGSVR
jgi:hypothetical protein